MRAILLTALIKSPLVNKANRRLQGGTHEELQENFKAKHCRDRFQSQNEIEIFENQDDSFCDKYLNEVIYLFENPKTDVIVFEDMDRFEMNHIFERLREVNTLANIQLAKK